MKKLLLLVLICFSSSLCFAQTVLRYDTVISVSQSDTIIKKAQNGFGPNLLVGTSWLMNTPEMMTARGAGLWPNRVYSECLETVEKSHERLSFIEYTDSSLVAEWVIFANCCQSFACHYELKNDSVLNFIYYPYGTYCACNCKHILTYELIRSGDDTWKEHFEKIKYVTINDRLKSLKDRPKFVQKKWPPESEKGREIRREIFLNKFLAYYDFKSKKRFNFILCKKRYEDIISRYGMLEGDYRIQLAAANDSIAMCFSALQRNSIALSYHQKAITLLSKNVSEDEPNSLPEVPEKEVFASELFPLLFHKSKTLFALDKEEKALRCFSLAEKYADFPAVRGMSKDSKLSEHLDAFWRFAAFSHFTEGNKARQSGKP